jgi:hypothetical protein
VRRNLHRDASRAHVAQGVQSTVRIGRERRREVALTVRGFESLTKRAHVRAGLTYFVEGLCDQPGDRGLAVRAGHTSKSHASRGISVDRLARLPAGFDSIFYDGMRDSPRKCDSRCRFIRYDDRLSGDGFNELVSIHTVARERNKYVARTGCTRVIRDTV